MDRPAAPAVAGPVVAATAVMPVTSDVHPVEQLFHRPREQRMREHKYRCAQAIVFGLPVLGLQYFGRSLGGAEAAKWVAGLQAVLTGWVMYVAVTGMLFEGVLLLFAPRPHRRISADLVVSLLAIGVFIASIAQTARLMLRLSAAAPWFHVCVLILIVWSALRWYALSRASGVSELNRSR